MQGSLPSSSITSIWHLWRRSLLCLHPSRVCRHRAYCKWRATSRLRNPTSTSLTNASIGLRIGRLWVSTSTSNLLTTKQYSSFCFWLSAWFTSRAASAAGRLRSDGQTRNNAINRFDSRAAASKDATSVREHHLGFQACVTVVLSIQIAKNLKSQITGAVSRSHSPYAEIIFHQVGNVRDVGGVVGQHVKSAFD